MTSACECVTDGFCRRYQRYMGGRMRELCAGINVDIGTAAAFREQWAREAGKLGSGVVTTSDSSASEPAVGSGIILLKNSQAPGDAVAMTAAIYSLHQAHPGKYTTLVESRWPEVFLHNPHVFQHIKHPDDPRELLISVGKPAPYGAKELRMHYPAIHSSNDRGIHFMQGWCEFLSTVLGVPVPLMTNRPRLYFEDSDPAVKDYWLICSGGKDDLTNKLWGHSRYQKVVDILRGKINFVQVGHNYREHTPLDLYDGSLHMVSKTTLRQLFELVRRARGVLCGVSLLMHVAAALEKPAVVIAGGREPVQWNAYPKQHYLHTVGALPCRSTTGQLGGACWRSRVIPIGDNLTLDKDPCERPISGVPECMTLIQPEEVANLILRYNRQYEYAADR